MGMSASQARMLSITSRLSDLELSAQNISNSKIRLSVKSEDVSKAYSEALNNKKLVFQSTSTKVNANNLTAFDSDNPLNAQRILKSAIGQVLLDSATSAQLSNDLQYYSNAAGLTSTQFMSSYKNVTAEQIANLALSDAQNGAFLSFLGSGTGIQVGAGHTEIYDFIADSKNKSEVTHFANLFLQSMQNGYSAIPEGKEKDSEWLYSQLQNGNVHIEKYSNSINGGEAGFQDISFDSGDTSLQEVYDTSDDAAAEAEYNTKMAEINTKDKQFDLDLKNIDTEHNAMQTELESIKKVQDKNMERAFKIFNG